jgi:hypothetical protein
MFVETYTSLVEFAICSMFAIDSLSEIDCFCCWCYFFFMYVETSIGEESTTPNSSMEEGT